MLPRPRLVCQEPGLRPIGRSPGVPDKSRSSRGLGSMSRYFAQILICFIAYIFQFILFLCGFGWELCRTASMHSAFCHCPSWSEWCWSSDNQKFPACLAEAKLAHQNTLWHLCHILMKLTDSIDEICINGMFLEHEPSEWRVVYIPVSNLLYFSLESRLIPAMLVLGQVRLFWKLCIIACCKTQHGRYSKTQYVLLRFEDQQQDKMCYLLWASRYRAATVCISNLIR